MKIIFLWYYLVDLMDIGKFSLKWKQRLRSKFFMPFLRTEFSKICVQSRGDLSTMTLFTDFMIYDIYLILMITERIIIKAKDCWAKRPKVDVYDHFILVGYKMFAWNLSKKKWNREPFPTAWRLIVRMWPMHF